MSEADCAAALSPRGVISSTHPNAAVEASGNIFWNDDGTTEWRFLSNNTNGKVRFRGVNYIPTNRFYDNSLVDGVRRYDYTGHTGLFGEGSGEKSPGINPDTFLPSATSIVVGKGIAGPSFTPPAPDSAGIQRKGRAAAFQAEDRGVRLSISAQIKTE